MNEGTAVIRFGQMVVVRDLQLPGQESEVRSLKPERGGISKLLKIPVFKLPTSSQPKQPNPVATPANKFTLTEIYSSSGR